MKRNYFIVLIGLALLVFAVSGCGDMLRFAPKEEIKQMAYYASESARYIDDNGIQPGTETTAQMRTATDILLDYSGMPAIKKITDFKAIADQAAIDAKERPTAKDVAKDVLDKADKGLTIIEALVPALGVFGVGVVTLGGIIRKTRKVTTALKEVVTDVELAKTSPGMVEMNKSLGQTQSPETQKIVASMRVDVNNKL